MHDVHHTLKIKVRSWARGYTAFSHATHSAHVQQDCHTDLKVREDKLLKDIMSNETVVVTYEYVPRKKTRFATSIWDPNGHSLLVSGRGSSTQKTTYIKGRMTL